MHSGKYIHEIETEKALSDMLKTDMGIHYMIVYKDLDTLRKFYSHYTKIQNQKIMNLLCSIHSMKLLILLDSFFMRR
ncbi:MAG: hypothetical protein ACTHKK_08410 [Candidatus Nitrosocosmicus sp.]